MLGHTDAGFTMNTYMHITDNMQQTVADTMEALLESSIKDNKIVKSPAQIVNGLKMVRDKK